MKKESCENQISEAKEDGRKTNNIQRKQKHWICPEIRANRYLFDESDPGHVVDERFETCLAWYIKRATFYKHIFHALTLVGCVFPLVAALFSSLNDSTFMVSILSVGASVSTAVLSQLRAQEKWTEYRSAAEFLKRQRTLYLASLEEGEDNRVKQREFLKLIEEYMEDENTRWKAANKADQAELLNIDEDRKED